MVYTYIYVSHYISVRSLLLLLLLLLKRCPERNCIQKIVFLLEDISLWTLQPDEKPEKVSKCEENHMS